MVALSESSIFEEIIRRIETTDAVQGGEPNPGTGQAPPNIALLQLANRTRWLFDIIEEMYTNGEIDAAIAAAVGVLTANEILTRIKTVDGAGSGLDADLLDGLHASAFWRNSQAPALLATEGYQTLPSGLIMQWGRALGSVTVTFPVAFPSVCYSLVQSDEGSILLTGYENLSTTGFTQLGESSPARTTRFFAVGV